MHAQLTLEEADALLVALGAGVDAVLPLVAPQSPLRAHRDDLEQSLPFVQSHQATGSDHSKVQALSCSLVANDAADATKKKKKKSATPTRDRERRELVDLRARVLELSERLQLLSATDSNSCRVRLTGRAAILRHIARSNLEQRALAESENRMLRLAVQRHSRMISAFQSRIQAFRRIARPGKSHPLRQSSLDATDRAVLEQMIAELDEAFAEVDSALPLRRSSSHRPFVSLPHRRRNTFTRHDIVGDRNNQTGSLPQASPLIVLEDERLIPFSFERVVDAAWRAWVLWHIEGACCFGGCWSDPSSLPTVERPESTFAIQAWLRSTLSTLGQAPTFIKVKLAVRKYTTADRLVLVWRGTTEGEREFDGLYTDETAWVTVERDTTSESPSNEFVVMRWHVRLVPRCRGGAFSAQEVQEFTRLVVQSYQDDEGMIYEEIESLLLRRR